MRQRADTVIVISRLIPEVPQQDALVLAESGQKVFHIFLHLRIECHRILTQRDRRILHPSRVVNTRLRIRLFTISRLGVPAIIEDGEERLDLVFLTDGQEIVHTLLQALRIILINNTAQIDTQGIESQLLGPA